MEVAAVAGVAVGFEGEVIGPVVDEWRVFQAEAGSVPGFVVREGAPVAGGFEAGGGFADELAASVVVGFVALGARRPMVTPP